MNPDRHVAVSLRNIILICFFSIFLSAGAFYGFWYFKNHKSVSLEASPGTKIELGIAGDHDESAGEYIKKLLVQTDNTTKVRLKTGSYIVRYSGDGLQEEYDEIHVPEITSIKTPVLSYSGDKLSEQLKKEKPSIDAVLRPLIQKGGYTIGYEALFVHGNWYAAGLVPAKSSNQDIVRIILSKKSGEWKISAGPAMVFYLPDLPGIPEIVIRYVNNRFID